MVSEIAFPEMFPAISTDLENKVNFWEKSFAVTVPNNCFLLSHFPTNWLIETEQYDDIITVPLLNIVK